MQDYKLYSYTIDDIIDKFWRYDHSTMEEMRINYEYIRTMWRIARRVRIYGKI